ncbi:MAG: exodeoxyribonuclease III [Pseudomonadota bacterium]
MRIATWNINGLRARLDFLCLWLEQRQPDVVGLQELKITNEEFPTTTFEAMGYQVAVHGQKSWNGVAILSRLPIEQVETGLPGEETLGSRLIRARIADLSFTTVYVPNGKDISHADFPLKLKWLESLTTWWADNTRPDEQAVLCGDFNICHTPLDCWRGASADGTIFCTDEERKCFDALLETGLIDLFRRVKPQDRTFSWWDYRGGAFHRGQGLRIDLILGSPVTARRLGSVEVDRDFRKKQDGLTASDHAPVIAELV